MMQTNSLNEDIEKLFLQPVLHLCQSMCRESLSVNIQRLLRYGAGPVFARGCSDHVTAFLAPLGASLERKTPRSCNLRYRFKWQLRGIVANCRREYPWRI